MSDKPRVLYVDDEERNLTAFRYQFETWYEVVTASSGDEALEILYAQDIQVVISDQRMPGMTGAELLERTHRSHPRTVRMILTGYSDIEAAIDAMNKGRAYHYFRKPWDETEVRIIIDNALEALDLEDRAREFERRYTGFLQTARDPISYWKVPTGCTADLPVDAQVALLKQGVCVDASAPCWEDAGLTREEFIGKPIGEIVVGDPYEAAFERFVRGGYQLVNHEVTVETAGDATIHLLETWSGVVEDGALTHLWATTKNISELKRIEAELRIQRDLTDRLVDALPGVFFLTDEANRLRRWNENLPAVTGYSDEELDGLESMELVPEDRRDEVRERARKVIDEGATTVEAELLTKEGTRIPYFLSAARIDIEGSPHRIGTGVDLSARVRAERALSRSEQQLVEAQRLAKIGNWELDVGSGRLECSEEIFRIYGMEPQTPPPPIETFMATVHPDDYEQVAAVHEDALRRQVPYEAIHRIVRPDGTIRVVRENVHSDYDEQGAPVRSFGTVQDITREHAAEGEIRRLNEELEARVELRTRDLRASEEKFRALVETTSDWIWEVDAEGRYTYASPRIRDLLGYEPEEVLGKNPFDMMPPDEAARVGAEFGRIMEARASFDALVNRNRHKDGSLRVLETSGVPILAPDETLLGYRGVDRDVTERKAAEELLRESEEKLRTIAASIQSALIMLDSKGRVSFWNDAATRIFGWSEEEMLGEDLHERIVPKRYRGDFYKAYPRFRETGTGAALGKLLEMEALTRDGTEFPVDIALSAVQIKGEWNAIGLVTDTTERRAVEEKVRTLARAIEASPVTVVVTDPDGTILYVNPRCKEVTGYAPDETIGQNPRIWKSEDTPQEVYDDLWATISAGETWQGEFKNRKKNGDHFWERSSISPVKNDAGEITHFVGVKEDITERKAWERELEEAKEAAESASQAKTAFLANMSHEIRTPMNAIIGMTHLLRQTRLDPRQLDYADKVDRAGKTLLHLIDDILDLSKIEAGRLETETIPFRVDDLLSDLAAMIGPQAHRKGLNLVLDTQPDLPRNLVGDPTRISQVLMNLVSNAVKFTAAGEVVVRSEAGDPTADRIELLFMVRDTGIGMTDEQVANLFQPFTQVDGSVTRRFGGTGLGLSISKRLVELMGGWITVESESGRGSTFRVGIPLQRIDDRFDLGPVLPKLMEARVVVADPSAAARDALTKSLAAFGCQVEQAADLDALGALLNAEEGAPPAVGFVDAAALRDADGFEPAAFRRSGEPATIWLLTSPAFLEEYGKDIGPPPGFDGHLLKPFSRSTLLDHLMAALGTTPPPHRRRQADSTVQARGQGHILVAEDSPINQEVTREVLELQGYRVSLADDGLAAVSLVEEADPPVDLVLMDLQMPVLNGYDAAKRIRALPERGDVPIAAMTADVISDIRQRCLDAGMDAFLTKPVEPARLFETLAGLLSTRAPPAGTGAEPAGIPPDLADLDGVDAATGLVRASGQEDLYRRLLRRFAVDHEDTSDALRQALRDGAHSDGLRIAHRLKGDAGNLGMDAVGETVAALHAALRTEAVDAAVPLLSELDQRLGAVLQGLRSLEEHGAPAAATEPQMAIAVDRDGAAPLVRRLDGLLPQADLESEAAAAQLADLLEKTGFGRFSRDLLRQVKRFEYQDAHRILMDLARYLDLEPSGGSDDDED